MARLVGPGAGGVGVAASSGVDIVGEPGAANRIVEVREGFGIIRDCRAASRIGPLYAASPEIAGALVSALAAKTGATAVAIDVPDRNRAAVRLAEQMGLKPAFETARMYTGADPAVDYAGLFGVTSLELG